MKKLILIFAALFILSGCASTIDKQVVGFPQDLKVVVHTVSLVQMLKVCYPAVVLWQKLVGSFPLACADVNLYTNTCQIWVTPNDNASLAHEMQHCRGGDHNSVQQRNFDGWLAWRKQYNVQDSDIPALAEEIKQLLKNKRSKQS